MNVANNYGPGTHREPAYWTREDGRLVGTAEPGPGNVIEVRGDGSIILDGVQLGGPGHSRWLGNRLIEAATLAEMEITRGR